MAKAFDNLLLKIMTALKYFQATIVGGLGFFNSNNAKILTNN